MPGRLQTENGTDILCKPKDVSTHGLGIVSNEQLKVGSALKLAMRDGSIIDLMVSWGQPGFGKRDELRYGLVTQNPEIDLEQIFIDTGCLK
jgi:hypothetical protein